MEVWLPLVTATTVWTASAVCVTDKSMRAVFSAASRDSDQPLGRLNCQLPRGSSRSMFVDNPALLPAATLTRGGAMEPRYPGTEAVDNKQVGKGGKTNDNGHYLRVSRGNDVEGTTCEQNKPQFYMTVGDDRADAIPLLESRIDPLPYLWFRW